MPRTKQAPGSVPGEALSSGQGRVRLLLSTRMFCLYNNFTIILLFIVYNFYDRIITYFLNIFLFDNLTQFKEFFFHNLTIFGFLPAIKTFTYPGLFFSPKHTGYFPKVCFTTTKLPGVFLYFFMTAQLISKIYFWWQPYSLRGFFILYLLLFLVFFI